MFTNTAKILTHSEERGMVQENKYIFVEIKIGVAISKNFNDNRLIIYIHQQIIADTCSNDKSFQLEYVKQIIEYHVAL